MCDQEDKGFLKGLVIGGLIGTGLYFLFGTEKGKKIQKELKEKGKEAAEKIEGLLDELEEKGEDLEKKVEEVKKQIQERIEDTGEITKEQIGEKLDSTLDKIEQLQERGRQTTASIHADLKKRLLFKNLPKR